MDIEVVEDETRIKNVSSEAFRANLQRFKHATSSTTHKSTSPPEPLRRSSRKRPPTEAQDAETQSTSRPDIPTSTSPKKKLKKSSSTGYAPPSKYAHLSPLTDILTPNLICIFVGFNPGITTSTAGHAYAHPSNLFWKLLHSSGCTDTRLHPSQDVDLPRLYSMGNTNIVSRPSLNAGELSKSEMAAGTPILEEKVRNFRPEAVCIVGKGIWEAIWRWRYGRGIKKEEFRYGWQGDEERMGKSEDWEGARTFVATATSGLAAGLRPHEKEAIWRPFGQWVKQRRNERVANATGIDEDGAIH